MWVCLFPSGTPQVTFKELTVPKPEQTSIKHLQYTDTDMKTAAEVF